MADTDLLVDYHFSKAEELAFEFITDQAQMIISDYDYDGFRMAMGACYFEKGDERIQIENHRTIDEFLGRWDHIFGITGIPTFIDKNGTVSHNW